MIKTAWSRLINHNDARYEPHCFWRFSFGHQNEKSTTKILILKQRGSSKVAGRHGNVWSFPHWCQSECWKLCRRVWAELGEVASFLHTQLNQARNIILSKHLYFSRDSKKNKQFHKRTQHLMCWHRFAEVIGGRENYQQKVTVFFFYQCWICLKGKWGLWWLKRFFYFLISLSQNISSRASFIK